MCTIVPDGKGLSQVQGHRGLHIGILTLSQDDFFLPRNSKKKNSNVNNSCGFLNLVISLPQGYTLFPFYPFTNKRIGLVLKYGGVVTSVDLISDGYSYV